MLIKKKKAATVNYFRANPMAEMECLVIWIPNHAEPNFET